MRKSLLKYFPVFIIPLVIIFVISFIIPFLLGLVLSFTDFQTVNSFTFNGINNYIKAFTIDRSFVNSFWFTTGITIVSVVTVNIISFILALLLSKNNRVNKIFRTIYFMPNLIGGIVLGYIWNIIINAFLGLFGVDITYSAKYGFWGLILLMNWQMIGYYMIIYISGIQAIPYSLIESAKIDGANNIEVLKNIIIPMLMPSITVCVFLSITNSFKTFDANLALTAGAPGKETQMLALDIFNTFYGRSGFNGVGQAKSVIFFIIVGTIAAMQLWFSQRKEVE